MCTTFRDTPLKRHWRILMKCVMYYRLFLATNNRPLINLSSTMTSWEIIFVKLLWRSMKRFQRQWDDSQLPEMIRHLIWFTRIFEHLRLLHQYTLFLKTFPPFRNSDQTGRVGAYSDEEGHSIPNNNSNLCISPVAGSGPPTTKNEENKGWYLQNVCINGNLCRTSDEVPRLAVFSSQWIDGFSFGPDQDWWSISLGTWGGETSKVRLYVKSEESRGGV